MRERESMSKRGAEERERERGRERILSRLHTVSTEPDAGFDPMRCDLTI